MTKEIDEIKFQSSPSLGAGSNCCLMAKNKWRIKVSILSQLRCWEQLARLVPGGVRGNVSILSQLRCWEQPPTLWLDAEAAWFQSSPSLGAGSNGYMQQASADLLVSILSQLRCWEQRLIYGLNQAEEQVSILSQLRCWEQLPNSNTKRIVSAVSILSQLRCWEQR